MLAYIKTVGLCLILFFIFSCAQKKVTPTIERNTNSTLSQSPEPNAVHTKNATINNIHESEKFVEQLTFHGDNSQPSFSEVGNKFVYISKDRYHHTNPQVYEYNFEKKEENRVIFQDGESQSPLYSDYGASIIYASTTDEIKENPLYLYNKIYSLNVSSDRGVASESIFQNNEEHAFELYKKHLVNDDFIRLTKSKKLDNNMSYYRKGSFRLFTSVRHGNLEIYKYRPQVPHSPVRLTFSDFIDDEPEYSPTHLNFDYVWVRYGQQSTYSQILHSNTNKKTTKKELTYGNQFHINPIWHPNGEYIYYSATHAAHKNFQLYVMKSNGECKTRVTYSSYKDFQPTIDPELKYIVFTRKKSDKQQIFKTKLVEPKCIKS